MNSTTKIGNPTSCRLCGELAVYEPGICDCCGFDQTDWVHIKNLRENVILRCPWLDGTERCSQVYTFSPADLTRKSYYVFYGRSLSYFPRMRLHCPTCGRLTDGMDFILSNLSVLRQKVVV